MSSTVKIINTRETFPTHFISVGELLQGGNIDISLCVLLGTTSDPAPFS
jgi:hypothetical protein